MTEVYLRPAGVKLASGILAACFAASLVAASPALAYAADMPEVTIPKKYQEAVERTTSEYKDAQAKVDDAQKAIEDNQARIADLERKIPEQQERSAQAAREQYKLEQQGSGVIDALLGIQSFSDLILNLDYISQVSEANVAEMNRLADMKIELEACEKDLVKAKWDAKANAAEAKKALDAAKEARQEAQRKAQEEARRQAELLERARVIEAAKAAALAQGTTLQAVTATDAAEEESDTDAFAEIVEDVAIDAEAEADAADELDSADEEAAQGDDSSEDADGAAADDTGNDAAADAEDGANDADAATDASVIDDSAAGEGTDADAADASADDELAHSSAPVDPEEAPSADVSYDYSVSLSMPTDDGADWTMDEKEFVKEWGPRIDAYLAGSALDGQGDTFAKAAWTYGIDPRWSPAIACTESSLGGICFRPYNAWGWGNSSWSSWEEAIDAHVGGLSRGYGYTITVAAAQTYCPPNWAYWYNTTLGEMNRI